MPTESPIRSGETPTPARTLIRVLGVVVLYLIVSSVVANAFLTRWGLGHTNPDATLTKMVRGEAARPFALRVLTPLVIRETAALVPETVLSALEKPRRYSRGPVLGKLAERYGERETDPALLLAGSLVLLGAAFATLWTWRALVVALGIGSRAFRDVAPAGGLLLLPLTFSSGGYVYDLPGLLLASLCLLCVVRRAWIPYYACFAAAMFNKESSLILAAWPVALFTLDRSRRALLIHLAVHAAIGLPILLGLRAHFAANPGTALECHMSDNLTFFLDPRSYLRFFDVYAAGIPAPEGFNVLNVIVFGALLGLGWRGREPRIRRVFLATVVCTAPLFLAFGFQDEIRVFGPAFPALFLLSSAGFLRLYGARGSAETS